MEQVILDHYGELIKITENKLIALFGLYPNFILEGDKIISGGSLYHGFDEYWTSVNWKKEGVYLHFIKDELMTKGRFHRGLEEGLWEKFNFGEAKSWGNFLNGEKEGYWEEWENLHFMKGEYHKGRKVGIWKTYYSNGRVKSEMEY